MSELKVHKAYNRWLDEEMPTTNDDLICNDVYLKEEADKVFAEKDKEIARLNDKALQYKVLDKEHCRDLNTQERRFALQMAHQKYKRCLAMAILCQWKMGVFIYKKEKSDFYYRWYRRWLELAEKFKDKEV